MLKYICTESNEQVAYMRLYMPSKIAMLLTLALICPAVLLAEEQVAMKAGDVEVLRYQAEPLSNPKGNANISADEFKIASHFIHPLKTPSGFAVTEAQPADHPHHFGLWWPWKHIMNGDRELVTWEQQARQGYVRATSHRWENGNLVAEAEYVDRLAEGGPEVLLKETATLAVSEIVEQPAKGYYLDITISQTPAVERNVPVTAYRYSGFAMRGTLHWNNDNSTVLSSEGKDRTNGNGTKARWLRWQGTTPSGGQAGVLIMTHPRNRRYPEQIRIWPKDWHHGALFANFNPVMTDDWVLEPGKTYTRKYRLFVYDGEVSAEQADKLQAAYAIPGRKLSAFDNGLTDVTSVEAQAKLLKELGYDGICTRPNKCTPELLAACDKFGVDVAATYITLPGTATAIPPAIIKHIERLKGRDTLVWLNIDKPNATVEQALSVIHKVCDLAAANGLEVVLYPHINCRTDTVERTEKLRKLANRDNLGISFNVCHFLAQTDASKLEETIRSIAPNLKLVQVSGANQLDQPRADWNQLILPLDEGDFDVGRVFRTLDEIGYDGPVNLQCYRVPLPAREHLVKSMNAWRKYNE